MKKKGNEAETGMGYCLTKSRYNELYRDIAVMACSLDGERATIQSVVS